MVASRQRMSYLYAPLQNRDVLSPTAREENHEANALDPACYQSMAQAREGDHRPLGWGDWWRKGRGGNRPLPDDADRPCRRGAAAQGLAALRCRPAYFLISTFPNRHSVPLVFAARVRAPVIAALQH